MNTIEKLVRDFLRVKKSLPEITYVGNGVLRKKSPRVTQAEGVRVAKKLMATLKKYRVITGVGRGLAAPQIGIGKAVFVTYVNDEFQAYINPKIVSSSRKNNYFRELCISSGLLWGDVRRPEKITLTWIDEWGKKHTQKFEGFLARLLQHEYDHLQGVVNLDRVEPGSIEFCLSDVTKEKLRSHV